MKLAVLGGSFNPVHKGHLFLAKQAADEYGYERVLFIPAREPPHKNLASGASDADRLKMLKNALNEYGDNRFFIDDCELKRSGPSYTIDTVYDLEARYAGALDGKIGLIIGSDLTADFSKWKNADLLAEKTDILLGRRPLSCGGTADFYSVGEPYNAGETFPWPHFQLHNEFYAVSSAAIRRMTAEKKEWKHLVPASVYGYIVERKLYGFE